MKKASHWKKYILPAVLLLLALVTAVYLYQSSSQQKGTAQNTDSDDYSVVLTVEGEPVVLKEFLMFYTKAKDETFIYYRDEKGMKVDYNDESFWTSAVDGKTPLDAAREKAVETAVRIKIQQITAKEKGITGDISYKHFHDTFTAAAEAMTEQKAPDSKGASFIDERSFYSETNDKIFNKLNSQLKKENVITISEDELRVKYDILKESDFKKRDDIKVNVIGIQHSFNRDSEQKRTKAEAKMLIEDIKARLDKGESFDALANTWNDPEVKFEEIFDANTKLGMNLKFMRANAENLKVGEISGILEGMLHYYIIKCIERTGQGYFTFEESKDTLEKICNDEKYDRYIEDLRIKADVAIDENVLKEITK